MPTVLPSAVLCFVTMMVFCRMAMTKNAGAMDPRAFRLALIKLGWKCPQAAEKMGVTAGQVSAWQTGRVPVPGPVAAYIRLALKVMT